MPHAYATTSLHDRLRAATSADHARLDTLMSGFDLTDGHAYCAFLTIHALALEQIGPWWRAGDAGDFGRLRIALMRDLRALAGVPAGRPARADFPPGAQGHGWGIGYVLRGSRLGARLLRGRVGPGLSTFYLDQPLETGWRTFLDALDQTGRLQPELQPAIIKEARATFGLFASLAQPPCDKALHDRF